jgi:hypothetical protein
MLDAPARDGAGATGEGHLFPIDHWADIMDHHLLSRA